MRPASIYSCPTAAREPRKEALIDAQLHVALGALAEIERKDVPNLDRRRRETSNPAGLVSIRHREAVLALGPIAHIALADVEKRTLIAGDMELDGEFPVVATEDIESLIWSCANTRSVVALGRAAWRSIQLLPVGSRRFHRVPPLKMPPVSALKQDSVLVVDHAPAMKVARDLTEALRRDGREVAYVGADAPNVRRDAVWDDRSAIHVHVGDHTLDAEEPRLVDSWVSDRLAIQLEIDRVARHAPDCNTLRIEDEVNGFICASAEAVVATCRELRQDAVLRRKLTQAGRATVAPLVASWAGVAEDMLAG